MKQRPAQYTQVHLGQKQLTEQVDDPFVVGSKQPDGIFKQEHEGGINDSIREFVRIYLLKDIQF